MNVFTNLRLLYFLQEGFKLVDVFLYYDVFILSIELFLLYEVAKALSRLFGSYLVTYYFKKVFSS